MIGDGWWYNSEAGAIVSSTEDAATQTLYDKPERAGQISTLNYYGAPFLVCETVSAAAADFIIRAVRRYADQTSD